MCEVWGYVVYEFGLFVLKFRCRICVSLFLLLLVLLFYLFIIMYYCLVLLCIIVIMCVEGQECDLDIPLVGVG